MDMKSSAAICRPEDTLPNGINLKISLLAARMRSIKYGCYDFETKAILQCLRIGAGIRLPFHCFFNPNNQASLENNRNPFLTITKSIAWYAECVWVNRTDKTICREEKIRYGVNKERREEIKGNIGVEFSSTKGVVLSGSGLALNHQFADSSSTFFPKYSVRESAESFEVPPSTASALFTQRIWIKCSPPDSDVVVGEAEFLQSMNYHYRGCAL